MSKESIESLIKAEAEKLASEIVAKRQSVPIEPGESKYKLGAKLFIRTITFHYVGRVSFISDTELCLEDASWVADSGRFSKALASGALDELERYPDGVSVNRGSIVDVSPWKHDLPQESK